VTTFPGGGGGAAGATGASPSESAPSTPGGGHPGIQACMGFWDAQTHMTKREWAAACRRTQDRLDNLKAELSNTPAKPSPAKSSRLTRSNRR
jgi:hypothetical protein